MQRYVNFIASTTSTSSTLMVLSNATCTVYVAGTSTAATLYSDNGITPLANPFLSSSTGQVAFYAANGLYDLVVSKIGYLTVTISAIELDDLLAPSGSNSVGYLPAGTGAVASTVQSKLRQIKSASDYSSFATYLPNALSGGFFTQNGAVIQRMNDRLMVGGATLNDCAYPNVYQDWLTTFQIAAGLSNGSIASAQSAVLNSGSTSETAGGGLVTGIQSLNFASAGTNAIASGHYAVNNNATLATDAWALYAEAHKTTAASGSVYACELDTRTLAATTNPTPFQQGSVVGIQIASGCGLSAVGQFDASAAIQIQDNPKSFKVGINFGSSSIVGTDGTTGTGTAIAMAKGHLIAWYNSSQQVVGSIFSTCANTANATTINFTDSGLQIGSSTAAAISYFTAPASSVNWLQFTSSATGNPPLIAAAGTDTNVDLLLATQGAGVLRYGTYTAGVVAQTGYITIKDSGGTTRRLLVG